jgi:hypothetical protein
VTGTPFAHLNNPLLVPILNAPSESFASDTDSDSGAEVLFEAAERGGEGLWAGCSLGIVTGFQTRDNSVWVTWVGDVELFSNEYAKESLPSCVNLSPHIRTALRPVSGSPSLYSTSFRAPDRHGVFKFVLDHRRHGWTMLKSTTMVPIVPDAFSLFSEQVVLWKR